MPLIRGPVRENVIVEWRGDEISRGMSAAIRDGLEEMAERLKATSKRLVHHPGDSQGYATGYLQSDISATVPRRQGDVYRIIFGAFNTPYAFWQEILPQPTGRAYIRPAVDQHIRELRPLVQAHLRQQAGFSIERAPGGFNQPLRKTAGIDY